jgi:hypothetical protein
VGAVLTAVLAACSNPVPVPVAPYAHDPMCARVVLDLPRSLEGLERLPTGSQATVAWGDRAHPVVLRCGVEPPIPSVDHCVTADDGTTAVDWLAVPDEAVGATEDEVPWTFTTYGRSPAVEVRVPAAVVQSRSTSFLVDLGPAVAQVEQTRSCL